MNLHSVLFRAGVLGGAEAVEGSLKYKGIGRWTKSLLEGGMLTGNTAAGLKAVSGSLGPIGLALALGSGSLAASTAPTRDKHGNKVHRGLSKGVATAASLVLTDVVGGLLGGPVGQMVAYGIAGGAIERGIGKVLDPVEDFAYGFGKRVNHVNMGGDYQDTQVAYTMRQRAATELGSSLLNARMYLGKESALFHQ